MKNIVITGGAKGLGFEFAKTLQQKGHKIYVIDIDDSQKEVLTNLGLTFILGDVSQEATWTNLVIPQVDVLINNAGSLCNWDGPQNPEKMTLSNWRETHAINLDSTFLGCKWAISKMKNNKELGRIINLSSRSGKVGVPALAAYASSKAAILNYTKSVALYCAEMSYPITCNVIVPASIFTPLWENLWGQSTEQKKTEMAKTIPVGRMGEPKDLNSLIIFLALEASDYITGAEFVVDGGILSGTISSPK